ncbi:MAG: flagellar protein FlaG [Azonexus sp.]|nr:flagellar protein FlaG [Azonexus sp.]MDP3637817.1 flagellar protein FlaG [Azonexus sp.]MDZ4313934.1 flagellar protein FlaG [Azonexus sp.]
MDISSINSNIPGSQARPQPETSLAEVRQSRIAQNSSASTLLTEQSVAQTGKAEPARQEVEQAVKAVAEFIKPINSSIEFNLDEESGRTIVKVIDIETKDVIRQFPSEEMLSIAKALDTMKGLLLRQQA